MAAKTKAEEKAEQAEAIAKAIEAAIAAWSPPIAYAVKGFRLLRDAMKRRGDLTPEELAQTDADLAEAERLMGEIEARGGDYRRRREAETGGALPPPHGGD